MKKSLLAVQFALAASLAYAASNTPEEPGSKIKERKKFPGNPLTTPYVPTTRRRNKNTKQIKAMSRRHKAPKPSRGNNR